MAENRIPGSIGIVPYAAFRPDQGTSARWPSPIPGASGLVDRVARKPASRLFVEVLRRTQLLLPDAMRGPFAELLSPASLAIVAEAMGRMDEGNISGIGQVVEVLTKELGQVFMSAKVMQAAASLVEAVSLTASARSAADLDGAARSLARSVAMIGVPGLAALAFQGAGLPVPKPARFLLGTAADTRYCGMAVQHVRVFREVARRTRTIIAVRNTNVKSTYWIEKGFPPKPMSIGFKTSRETGIVTARTDEETRTALNAGFWVVDGTGIPRDLEGNPKALPEGPPWPVEPGQVIHPEQSRPLVGDYDLLDVIVNPDSPAGGNLTLAASGGSWRKDWTNPWTRRVARELNAGMDQPRVLHGTHAGRFTLPDGMNDGAIVFYPDNREPLILRGGDAIADWYGSLGRKAVGAPTNLPE